VAKWRRVVGEAVKVPVGWRGERQGQASGASKWMD
jgi:hypothetical protein